MKILFKRHPKCAYALVMVLVITLCSLVIMGGTMTRTYTVAKLNDRSNQLMLSQNAAEAAVEKVFSRMQYDFQQAGGPGVVSANLSSYRNYYPKGTENSYWTNFSFSDGTTANKVYVNLVSNYSGSIGQAYAGRSTSNAPIYRIMSNASFSPGDTPVVGTAQIDALLALVPLTTYAIFYSGLLEFSTCATMTVNGPVHSNTNIYVGAGGSATLTFNSTVTAGGTVTAPGNNGQTWGANWRTTFNGNPTYTVNNPAISLPIPMTNAHYIVEMPTTNDANTAYGDQRLYNQAQVVLVISNTTISLKVQTSPNPGIVPGADSSPTTAMWYMTNSSLWSSNLPFLTLSNRFYDGRESKTCMVAQVDVSKYATWTSNSSYITGKFPVNGSSYPTILYVADCRSSNGNYMASVRLTNGVVPPQNNGLGWTVATPNPLYVWGNYNCQNSSYLGTTNTSATLPCAFLSDALTILSPAWTDANSTASLSSRNASSTVTVNAAIVTGIVPSTGTTSTTFSGGVHNLPRLLEDWSSDTLWLNTSIINLYNSKTATGVFVNPGTYYNPPTRKFSYDLNFSDASKVPPGIPCALVALRWTWACPPPGVTTFYATP
ncbi:MAG: hypothetical protein U1F98_10665 [Verrucomicrobiota bacterium]